MTGHELFLSGRELSKVSQCVYFGVTLTGNTSNNEDTGRVTSTFLRQFHGIDNICTNHLFKLNTMSFLWNANMAL